MGGMMLLRPWWLLALMPWAVLTLWSWRRAPDAGGWQNVMDPHMLTAMHALGAFSGTAPRTRRSLAPLALLALILGLSGPAMPRSDAPVLAQADAVVLAVDLSPSVATGPGLAQAQIAAAALAQGLAGRPVGLIVYGGEAFTVAAPTTDVASLETQIAVMDADTLPIDGSRPADAIGLAAQMMEGLSGADLVVISDGGGIDAAALSEADRLEAAGARISAIQLTGQPEGATALPGDPLVPLLRGRGMVTDADGAPDLARRLQRGGATRPDAAQLSLQFRDLGPLLAMLAALPLLMMLRRSA